ncbi:hypothetical protein AB0B68_12745 [Micromonospora sp. NPDC049049]|uniref:hypothetical protein n=1 Tax=Micromonospora sp. NPDC049049 TaxID=3155495 RepID=UPI00340A130B
MDTTITVDTEVRDRLVLLANERGTTMRDLVAQLTQAALTADELRDRAARAEQYVRLKIASDLSADDLTRGEDVWAAVEAGNVPESLAEDGRRAA